MNKPEQRKHKRFQFREEIIIDGTEMCTSMDISEGGIYISAIQTFEKNSVIELTIPSR